MAEDRFVAHGLLMVGDRVLLLRRRAGRYLGEQWDIPGGTVERGESAAEAAVRECAEETGLAAHVGAELAHYSNLDTEGRDIVFHTLTYELRAAWTSDHVPRVELAEVEHDDHAWLTVREALDLPLVWHVRDTLEAVASC
jgi:8-oxo-dGTP diphosphatase